MENVIHQLFTFNPGEIFSLKIIIFSIIIEALPYMLIGVFVSAFLNNFISDKMIHTVMPKNPHIGILIACLLGGIFPVCECGIVPITRRLVMKGVPLSVATAFMLASPIINPVVATATAAAFHSINPYVIWLRLGAAFLVAFFTGQLVHAMFNNNELKRDIQLYSHCCGCNPGEKNPNARFFDKLYNTLQDACSEFFEMGKYLILGAFLSGLAQTFTPREILISIGYDAWLSIIAMMLFAFGVSVCSSADAFIAASFSTNFTLGSLLAFMVFGPMVDIKNTLMLFHAFRSRFVLLLIVIISLLCGTSAYLLNLFIRGDI